jgi:hypothetical protein
MAGGSTVKTFSTVSSRGEGKQDVGRTVTVVGRRGMRELCVVVLLEVAHVVARRQPKALGWREDGGRRYCANGGRMAGDDCEGGGADDCKGGERMVVGDVVPMAVGRR